MIAGVISFAPSHATPSNGSSNVSFPIASCAVAALRRPRRRSCRRRASSSLAICPPPGSFSSTVTPGRPSSPCSTTPGLPPPGLKSRHTTPVIAPAAAGGARACTAPLGHVLRRDPGEAELRGVARPDGPLEREPAARRCRASRRSRAAPRAARPAGRPRRRPPSIEALTAPTSGSFSSITRQITPAANSEIAIGMKTTVLKATDQRTRSSSTANTSPIAVTSAGTIASHSDVVLDRRGQGVLGEQLLVVVEPDEVRAAAVEEAAHDRVDRRIDDPHAEQDRRRGEERDRDAVPAPARRAPPAGGGAATGPAVAAPPLIGLGPSTSSRTPSPPAAPSPARCRRRRRGCAGSPGTPSRDPAPRSPPNAAGWRSERSKRNVSASPIAVAVVRSSGSSYALVVDVLVRARVSAALRPDLRRLGSREVLDQRLRRGRVLEHDDRVTATDHRRPRSRRSPGSRRR